MIELEAGQVEAHKIEKELGPLVQEALDACEPAAREKGIVIETRFEPRLRIKLDRKLTPSVLQNLLDNAVKYTDEGAVALRVDEQEQAFAFHVWDNCS